MVTPRDRHLLLCDAPAVQGSLLSAFLQHVAVSLEDATVVSNSGSLAKDALPQGAFASAVSVSEAAGQHKPALLRALIGALCPGGELVVQEAQVRVLVLCPAHACLAGLLLDEAVCISLCCLAREIFDASLCTTDRKLVSSVLSHVEAGFGQLVWLPCLS